MLLIFGRNVYKIKRQTMKNEAEICWEKPAMEVSTYNSSIQEAEAGGLRV
jgi:hypothetical protein